MHTRSLIAALFVLLACVGAARGEVKFFSDGTVLWQGRTAMIPFQLDQPAGEDRQIDAQITGSGVDILRPAEVLEGETVGFIRLLATSADPKGPATLTLDGSKLALRVQPLPEGVEEMDRRPRIVSPAAGAVVWGDDLGVGVEVWNDPVRHGPLPPVQLLLANGSRLDPQWQDEHPDNGPIRHLAFRVPLDKPGTLVLTPVVGENQGVPLAIRIVANEAVELTRIEAEDQAAELRPERYQDKDRETPRYPTEVGKDVAASGDRYAVQNSSNRPTSVPMEIAEPGWYAVIARAKGSGALATLPMVGLRLDNANNPKTASAIAAEAWHRTPIGTPFYLGKGAVTLSVNFENDANDGKNQDRNLHLDRVEIARLKEATKMEHTLPIDPDGLSPFGGGARIAFDEPLEGTLWSGGLVLEPRVLLPKEQKDKAPTIRLLVNDKVVQEQRTDDPQFRLHRGAFGEEAEATVQYEMLTPAGPTVRSVPQRVRLAEWNGQPTPRQTLRLPASDPKWTTAGLSVERDAQSPKPLTLRFLGPSTASFPLPENLVGPTEIALDLRGDQYDGPPLAVVTLQPEGKEAKPVGEVEGNTNNYVTRTVGTIDLPKGKKTLHVRFPNDKHDAENKKDRNLYVRAVRLTQGGEDKAAPTGEIVYPGSSGGAVHTLSGADAVVVAVADDTRVERVELLLDGQPTGLFRYTPEQPGTPSQLVLPVIPRDWEPGEHALAVRVRDAAGNQIDTPAVTVLYAPDTSDTSDAPETAAAEGRLMSPYARAIRLLQRLGYGPEERELAAVLTQGERAYLERALAEAQGPDPQGDAAAREAAGLRFEGNGRGSVEQRALMHQILTPNPVRGRLLWFTENHLTTWIRKTEGDRKAEEHARFARLGAAPFEVLLMTSATSPAMLRYLDQQNSRRNRINENYAREVMELHTLGVDAGYTQEDVTQLASLITGLTYTEEAMTDGSGSRHSTFRYSTRQNDPEARRVFGVAYPKARGEERFDRARLALETLARHPATARHLSRKLYEHFVEAPAPEEAVDALARAFHRSGGDLRAVILALHERPELWDADLPPRLTHPISAGVRLARLLRDPGDGAPVGQVWQFLERSGVGIYDRDFPDGYSDDDYDYADSNAMLQRWRLATDLADRLEGAIPGSLRDPAEDADEPAVRAWAQRVIDLMAVRLTGEMLREQSNEAAVELVAGSETTGRDRLRLAAAFVMQLPEVQLR